MKLKTRHFGEIEIEEANIVTFKQGIFGFSSLCKHIVLYDDSSEGNPFAWLQSIEEEEFCLPLISPLQWFPSYSPEIEDELVASIGELDESLLDVYTVVVIPEKIEDMTTNLKAPILINRETKQGIQVIADNDEYQLRHNLYEYMKDDKKESE